MGKVEYRNSRLQTCCFVHFPLSVAKPVGKPEGLETNTESMLCHSG